MLRALAIFGLAFGAWMMWKKSAEAAPVFANDGPFDPMEPAPPSSQVEPSGPPPELIPEPTPAAPQGIAGFVAAINDNEFGGWFAVADVLAVIEIESSFNPAAYRAEPRLGDASYGLMQLLSSTAADRGYRGPVEGLFDPETNIRLGMRQLKWSWDYLNRKRGVSPSPAEWIGSYNAGVGNVMKGYIPWGYVQRWQAARGRWGA